MILRSSVFDWLVVLINPDKRTEDVIINNPTLLTKFYEANKDEIWIGKNNTGYDQFIMMGILCGFDPKEVNDWRIIKGKSGWKLSSLFSKVPIIKVIKLKCMEGGLISSDILRLLKYLNPTG